MSEAIRMTLSVVSTPLTARAFTREFQQEAIQRHAKELAREIVESKSDEERAAKAKRAIHAAAEYEAASCSDNVVSISTQKTTYTKFKPRRLVVVETVRATYRRGDKVLVHVTTPPCASDILLTGAFSGSLNCFPNAPGGENGINCAVFPVIPPDKEEGVLSGGYGAALDWPNVEAGIPLTLSFAIRRGVLSQVIPPGGHTLDANKVVQTPIPSEFEIDHVVVTIDATLLGHKSER